ncbi:MAG: TlpA family protein disulfide reductase [Verrucomicrobia bacterium]|nr:TlpA family protein disulfide reductase [Verrucomicrobiota bacterium]
MPAYQRRSLVRITASLLLCCMFFFSSRAQQTSGELGMKAPALHIQDWIQKKPAMDWGNPTDTNIYIVEFWATWCGPCRVSIPHLSELQSKYRDQGVVFVGISNEKPDVIRPFVAKMGEKMNYAVAADANDQTTREYFQAFNVRGIPHAFIVSRDRRIVWQGHPMMGLDQAIDQVVKGKLNLEKAKGLAQLQKDFQSYFTLISTTGSSPESERLGEAVYSAALDNPPVLWKFAGVILEDPRVKHRDLKLALRAAQKANDLTESKEPGVLQTLSRAQSMNGQQKEAMRTQAQALALAQSESDRDLLRKGLEELQRNKPADR